MLYDDFDHVVVEVQRFTPVRNLQGQKHLNLDISTAATDLTGSASQYGRIVANKPTNIVSGGWPTQYARDGKACSGDVPPTAEVMQNSY